MEYYTYLSQKKIAGIVNHLKERLVYIVPSCPEMLRVAPISSPNQLIGIITTFDKKTQGVDQKAPQSESTAQESTQESNMEELEDEGEVKKKVIPKFDPRFGDTANSSDTNSEHSRADETDETGSIASASDSRS